MALRGLVKTTGVKVRGGRRSLGAPLSREINASAGGRGSLGSTNARGDGETRDRREGMLGLGRARARVVGRNRDTIGAGRATCREGGEVMRVGRSCASEAAREGGQLVSDMGASRGIVAADVDDGEATAVGARKVGAV